MSLKKTLSTEEGRQDNRHTDEQNKKMNQKKSMGKNFSNNYSSTTSNSNSNSNDNSNRINIKHQTIPKYQFFTEFICTISLQRKEKNFQFNCFS